MIPTCATCRFYVRGECRINPPAVTAMTATLVDGKAEIVTVTSWPQPDRDEWCGKYEEEQGGRV